MSGPSSYVPKSNLAKWFDERLPVVRLVHDSFIAFPTPRNLNYFWTFGGILTVFLVLQIVTGVILAMHYTASVGTAFESVQHIRRDVNYGWLIQPMHAVGASFFFIAVYIHIFRGLYYGSYKAPREILWILGVFILLAMMATAFLGYTLPWGQMSFWGATVITNLFSSIDAITPGWGTAIVTWLWGGFAVGNATLNRFFSLHYLLPFVIAGIVILHIWALHVVGQNNPTGLDIKQPSDSVPMTPYAVMKDQFAMVVFFIPFAYFVFFMPDYLGHADNYNEANPLVTPPHIVPEWYFLPFYAILRAITFDIGPLPAKLLGVLAMFASIAVLAFAPWLDSSRVRSCKYRPIMRWCFWGFVATCLALGYLGAMPAEPPYVGWAQFFTLLYFAYFFVAMPLVGLIETPSPMPRSITESVLGKSTATGGGGRVPAGASATPEKR